MRQGAGTAVPWVGTAAALWVGTAAMAPVAAPPDRREQEGREPVAVMRTARRSIA